MIGLGCFQNGIIEGCLIFKGFQFQYRGRNVPPFCPFQYLGIGVVANDAHHGAVDGAIHGGFVDGFRVGAPAGCKYKDSLLTH